MRNDTERPKFQFLARHVPLVDRQKPIADHPNTDKRLELRNERGRGGHKLQRLYKPRHARHPLLARFGLASQAASITGLCTGSIARLFAQGHPICFDDMGLGARWFFYVIRFWQ